MSGKLLGGAGDSDTNSCVLHGQSNSLMKTHSSCVWFFLQIVPALDNDEHVVYTNTCKQTNVKKVL